jgi:hypothetical protein
MNIAQPMNFAQVSYSSSILSRSNYYKSMFDTNSLIRAAPTNLCYTYSKNYIYKPHTAYGMVGTTASSYLASRRRL